MPTSFFLEQFLFSALRRAARRRRWHGWCGYTSAGWDVLHFYVISFSWTTAVKHCELGTSLPRATYWLLPTAVGGLSLRAHCFDTAGGCRDLVRNSERFSNRRDFRRGPRLISNAAFRSFCGEFQTCRPLDSSMPSSSREDSNWRTG